MSERVRLSRRAARKPSGALSRRPTFTVRLRPEPRVDPIRALRLGLKSLLRRYGLRCISAREETRR
jgi:hypothetical protein